MADNVVRPTQNAFMQGRYILDGVVTLHETVHKLHRKNMNGVIFKIDFEKAYDKVKWPFLFQVLKMKGFSPEWRALICNLYKGAVLPLKLMMSWDTISKQRKDYVKVTHYPQCYSTLWLTCWQS